MYTLLAANISIYHVFLGEPNKEKCEKCLPTHILHETNIAFVAHCSIGHALQLMMTNAPPLKYRYTSNCSKTLVSDRYSLYEKSRLLNTFKRNISQKIKPISIQGFNTNKSVEV